MGEEELPLYEVREMSLEEAVAVLASLGDGTAETETESALSSP